MDLVYFLPLRYEDRRHITPISSAEDSKNTVVRATVISAGGKSHFRGRGGRFKALVQDTTGRLELVWFNSRNAHLSGLLAEGRELWVHGRMDLSSKTPRMFHPEIMPTDSGNEASFIGIMPVYPSVRGFSNRMLREAVGQALRKTGPVLRDPAPADVIENLGLPSLHEALETLHFVPRETPIEQLNEGVSPYHRRILFDKFYMFMLEVQARAMSRVRAQGKPCPAPPGLIGEMDKFFPFSFTDSQRGAISEILEDMSRTHPMNRLLQGDVGCGKTAVAAVAAHVTALNGMQTAIMAPTQLLASQHFDYFSGLDGRLGLKPTLLTASVKGSERLRMLEEILDGTRNLILGTQSLIQDGTAFRNLGLVVIDEQHRFGVRQRRMLDQKGENPHVLVMSATPIPRTLAMTVHADLDISVIDRRPEGRMPVVTRIAGPEHKKDLYRSLTARLSAGQQAVVVCPVVEDHDSSGLKSADEMYSSLKRLLGDRFRIGLVHGRMPARQKDEVMEKFRRGRIDLLVGTTVIEVGIHAPGASVIIIEHPERFGLAQLHQLRGRVGRGEAGGVCVLMRGENPPSEAQDRLAFFVECNDGFRIAEYDMRRRGCGEFNGIRQAGTGEVDMAEVLREPSLLEAARKAARYSRSKLDGFGKGPGCKACEEEE